MNWTIIILVAIGAIALVVFLVKRNIKDEKEFEGQLKNDYPKTKQDEQGDAPAEETVN
jgi:hypothetical protein